MIHAPKISKVRPTPNQLAWFFFMCVIALGVFISWTQREKAPEIQIKEVPIEKIVKVEPERVLTSALIRFLNPKVDPNLAGLIGIEIDVYAKKHNLPRTLIVAIMRRESNFNPLAASKVAVGLMQLYPKWHPEKVEGFSRDQLFHIATNIDICSQIWAEYFEQNDGDIDKTIHAYLSKDASRKLKDSYKNDILTYIALLNIFEFRQLNKPNDLIAKGSDYRGPR